MVRDGLHHPYWTVKVGDGRNAVTVVVWDGDCAFAVRPGRYSTPDLLRRVKQFRRAIEGRVDGLKRLERILKFAVHGDNWLRALFPTDLAVKLEDAALREWLDWRGCARPISEKVLHRLTRCRNYARAEWGPYTREMLRKKVRRL
jgi:hypothetical protein